MTPVVDESLFQQEFDYIFRYTQSGIKGSETPSNPKLRTPNKVGGVEREEGHYQKAGKLSYPLLALVRVAGCCPISIVKSGGEYLFHFKFLSASFFYSVGYATVITLCLLTWISNSMLGNKWPWGVRIFKSAGESRNWIDDKLLKGSQLVKIMDGLIRFSPMFGIWVSTFLHWAGIRSLCRFLNSWPQFFAEFETVFKPHYYKCAFNPTKRRNVSVALWLSPLLVTTFMFRSIKFLTFDSWPLLNLFVSYFIMMNTIGFRSLCYLKDFALLDTLLATYVEVHNGIKAQYGRVQSSIRREQVRDWMNLIMTIRTQAVRLENYLSWHNLWSIFEVFYTVLMILSMAVFLFMNGVLSGAVGNFLPFSLLVSSFYLLSLSWKTYFAEELTRVEEAIAEEILEMDTADDDCETRLEMKLICDFIYNDPIKIRVGNILTLNARLILSFWSQLASYLIVIIQFIKT